MNLPAKPHHHPRSWLFWLSIVVVFFLLIYLVRSVLLPFVVGLLLAYFLDPLADRLQRNKIKRPLGAILITIVFFALFILALAWIIPEIIDQCSLLLRELPKLVAAVEKEYSAYVEQLLGGLPRSQMAVLRDAANGTSTNLLSAMGGLASNAFASGFALLNVLSLLLITPIVTFYMLRDWDLIVERIDALLPRLYADTIREQMRIIDRTIAGFIRGQLNVCVVLAAYYAIALTVVGLDFGLVIGALTGFLVILPYVGFLFGFLLGMGVAVFQFESMASISVVLGVFLVGQVLESYFLTPTLVGDRVGLHPVWIIFGMLAGAVLFGFVGVLLAIPITAVAGVLIRFAIARYRESGWYQA